MSSVKKIGKSRKTKAASSAKSRRATLENVKREPKAKKGRPASTSRTGRSSGKASAKRTTAARTKNAARKSARAGGRSRSVAVRTPALPRTRKTSASRQVVSPRKPTRQLREAKARGKSVQTSQISRAKQVVGRDKARQPEQRTAKSKLNKIAARRPVPPPQPVSQKETGAQRAISERRAHAEAVMALRATVAKPKLPPSAAGATEKVQKSPPARPNTASASPPRSSAAVPARPVAQVFAPRPAQPLDARPGDIRLPDKQKAAPKLPGAVKLGFKPTEFIVYPAHGVGQILAIEEQEVAGFKLELFVISFAKDKMILKVPTPKTVSVGMRKLASTEIVKQALDTLTGRARIKRTMWSRRAQEYEAKINSGDLVAIAEVIRDLYRSEAQPEQSYSERQLYEAALDRVAREIAVVHKLTETESLKLIDSQLQKGPRRSKAEESDIEGEGEAESNAGEAAGEGNINEAA